MRRALHRSQPLHSSRIGKAEGSHISARPPLLGCPLDGVKSVTALVFVRPKFAAGSVPATHILYDNRISTLDCAVKDRHFKGTNHSLRIGASKSAGVMNALCVPIPLLRRSCLLR